MTQQRIKAHDMFVWAVQHIENTSDDVHELADAVVEQFEVSVGFAANLAKAVFEWRANRGGR